MTGIGCAVISEGIILSREDQGGLGDGQLKCLEMFQELARPVDPAILLSLHGGSHDRRLNTSAVLCATLSPSLTTQRRREPLHGCQARTAAGDH